MIRSRCLKALRTEYNFTTKICIKINYNETLTDQEVKLKKDAKVKMIDTIGKSKLRWKGSK